MGNNRECDYLSFLFYNHVLYCQKLQHEVYHVGYQLFTDGGLNECKTIHDNCSQNLSLWFLNGTIHSNPMYHQTEHVGSSSAAVNSLQVIRLQLEEQIGQVRRADSVIFNLILLSSWSSYIPVHLRIKQLKSCCKTLHLSDSLLYDPNLYFSASVLSFFQLHATSKAFMPDIMTRNNFE